MQSESIHHIKLWWWAYFITLVVASKFVDWWKSLDFSYGSADCMIPIIGSCILVMSMWIPMMMWISDLDEDGGEEQ